MKKKIIFTILILTAASLFMTQAYILNFYNGSKNDVESQDVEEYITDNENELKNIYENSNALISNISLKDNSYIVNYEFKGEKEDFLKILDEVKSSDERFSISKIDKEMGNSAIEIWFTIAYKVP